MAHTEPSKTGEISLEELIALGDEIAALVRAGVPLEEGLTQLGGDLPGRLGRIASQLAERTARGEPLLQAVADRAVQLPPVYRAVIEAGLKAGRLPVALESLAGAVRRLAETRRTIAAAAAYPLLVLMFGCLCFAFFTVKIAPVMAGFFAAFRSPGRAWLELLASCGPSAPLWGTLIPLAILAVAIVWWYRSGRAGIVQPRWTSVLLGWLPWTGRTLRWSRAAALVEILAALVENGVPLDEAIVLAAEASGDPQFLPAARQLAEALRRGQPVASSGGAGDARLPPLVYWLLAGGGRRGELLPALRHVAEIYRRRARHYADLAQVLLPVLLTLAIGGSVTLLYAVSLFAPYAAMLKSLAGV